MTIWACCQSSRNPVLGARSFEPTRGTLHSFSAPSPSRYFPAAPGSRSRSKASASTGSNTSAAPGTGSSCTETKTVLASVSTRGGGTTSVISASWRPHGDSDNHAGEMKHPITKFAGILLTHGATATAAQSHAPSLPATTAPVRPGTSPNSKRQGCVARS